MVIWLDSEKVLDSASDRLYVVLSERLTALITLTSAVTVRSTLCARVSVSLIVIDLVIGSRVRFA